MRLDKAAAALGETGVQRRWPTSRSPESTGGASGRTIRSSASCAMRRRTRVVGAFPDGNSALNLAAARLRHIAGTRWSTKRYLNMQLLRQRNAMIA